MKKIDVHIHTSMWPKAQLQPGCVLATPEEIRAAYKELDIDKGFLLPLISPEKRFCVQTNEEMEYVANNNPSNSISDIGISSLSYLMCFAAELSRKTNTVVNMQDYMYNLQYK